MRRSVRCSVRMGAVLLASVAVLPAQQVVGPQAGPMTSGGPVMGLVAERGSNRLRPVLGVPGAAVVGEAFEPAGDLTVVQASPLGNYVVVAVGSAKESALWLPNGEVRKLAGIAAGAQLMALSPQGSAAAFLDAAAQRFEVFAGLPEDAVHTGGLAMAGVQGPYAVSDDGQLLLSAAEGAAVVWNASGERSRIALAASPVAMAFGAASHDALLAYGQEAAWIRRVELPAGRTILTANSAAPITAAAVASDGRTGVLALSSGEIAVFDLATGEKRLTANCHCAPEGLFRMNDSSALRITGSSEKSLLLIDTSSEPPRILTVNPAADPNSKP